MATKTAPSNATPVKKKKRTAQSELAELSGSLRDWFDKDRLPPHLLAASFSNLFESCLALIESPNSEVLDIRRRALLVVMEDIVDAAREQVPPTEQQDVVREAARVLYNDLGVNIPPTSAVSAAGSHYLVLANVRIPDLAVRSMWFEATMIYGHYVLGTFDICTILPTRRLKQTDNGDWGETSDWHDILQIFRKELLAYATEGLKEHMLIGTASVQLENLGIKPIPLLWEVVPYRRLEALEDDSPSWRIPEEIREVAHNRRIAETEEDEDDDQ